jgi:hypothetical protein
VYTPRPLRDALLDAHLDAHLDASTPLFILHALLDAFRDTE